MILKSRRAGPYGRRNACPIPLSCIRSFCDLILSEAETFDGGEYIIGGLCAYEGLGSFVMCIDEGEDVVFQCGCVAVNASADAVIGDQSEKALDLIDPGCSGWR